jgi:uncharacterized protein YkwD
MVAVSALAATLLALLAWVALTASPRTSAAAGSRATSCASATTPASQANTRELRKAARCLLNSERSVHGLSKLARETSLQRASQQHAGTMAASDCLAHRCGKEPDLETRIGRVGYLQSARAWRYAEETGCAVSAAAMVANWMASNGHRADILEPKYHELGVGVVGRRVKSRCEKGYATFAILLGWRELD